jgi:hypothetical protein
MWNAHIHFSQKARERGVKNVGGNMTFPPPEAEFLDEIQTKVLRVFLLAIHSHLYSFALRFLFLQTHATIPSSLWFKKSIQKSQV